jgi:integrase
VIRISGQGRVRQDTTKGKKKTALLLPDWAIVMLRSRANAATTSPDDLIFPSGGGGMRDVRALARQVNRFAIRNPQWEGLSTRLLRRTVGTAIERAHGIDVAAKQLTHSGSATTQRHYVTAHKTGPDVRDTLNCFGLPADTKAASFR